MDTFIQRQVFNKLKDHLQEKEMTLLIGPRQAGKTTLMEKLKDYLDGQDKKTIYFNLDFEEQKTYFRRQIDLINYLDLQFGKKEAYVFIDEAQRLPNAGLFLKGLYDRNLPYKYLVSGSGSLELKEKIHESLAGRKRIFEISPITFFEFLNFKTNYQFEKKLEKFFLFDKVLPQSIFEEYLKFGGYPKVVLNEQLADKKAVIREIYQSYLEKDIQTLINLDKKEAFIKLTGIVSSQAGQLVNYAELSRSVGIDFETVKKYLWYLEKTFIIEKVSPFYTNVRKELSKMPVYYFTDLGLRHFVLNQWTDLPGKTQNGFLFQNFIFLLLKQSKQFAGRKINFWRTKDNAEVDFIITSGVERIPVEVKETELKDIAVSRSFKNFILKYQPKKAYLINKTLNKEIKLHHTKVTAIPYWRLLV